ncbi:transmembrane sensor [Janthinobacterium lividum]|uniref:FecR family protein n=1 Tax=Janthinobacterium lividum TaxID=29581 RepID=UPI003D1FABB3
MSPRKSFEHALLLIARRHGGGAAAAIAAEQELSSWREHSSDNDAIYRLALNAWHASSPDGLEERIARPPPAGIARRKIVVALGLLGMASLTGAAARWHWLQPVELATLNTGRSQLLVQRMADGSELHLAARTSAAVAYYRDRREVTLKTGEIHLQVSRDASRPFSVHTPWGKVAVLGTTFTVAVRDSAMFVEVAEGHVAVWSGQDSGDDSHLPARAPSVSLRAGQAVRMGADGSGAVHAVAAASVGAWKDGWMVFNRTPLGEAVLRWNDYLARPLMLGTDKSLAGLRLTGSFRLAEPDVFLQVLPTILPVRLARREDGNAIILPK